MKTKYSSKEVSTELWDRDSKSPFLLQYQVPWTSKLLGKHAFLKHPFAFHRNTVLLSIPPGTETAVSGNVTEEEVSRTETPLPSENVTVIFTVTSGMNS